MFDWSVYVLAFFAIAAIAFAVVVLVADRRWYRKHPGANERFSAIDIELSSRER